MENPTKDNITHLKALEDRHLGPFRVIEVIRPGQLRLDLSSDPRTRNRHNVINIDKLFPAHTPDIPRDNLLFHPTDFDDTIDTGAASSFPQPYVPNTFIPTGIPITDATLPPIPIAPALQIIPITPAQQQIGTPPPPPLIQPFNPPKVTKTNAPLHITSISTSHDEAGYHLHLHLSDNSNHLGMNLFCEGSKHDAFKSVNRMKHFYKQLRSLIREGGVKCPVDMPPDVQRRLSCTHLSKKAKGGLIVLSTDDENNSYVLYSDADYAGITADEWDELEITSTKHASVNSVQVVSTDLLKRTWDLTRSEDVMALLKALQPGDWQQRHAAALCNKMYGGSRFNPLLVVTDRNEIADFAEHINADTFRKK